MEKKRRKTKKVEPLDLTGLNLNLQTCIAEEVSKTDIEGLQCTQCKVLSKFGKGRIVEFCFSDITVCICKFILSQDLLIHNKIDQHKLQLSFLLEGDKVIGYKNAVELPYGNHESYMANINAYEGYSRLFANKPFKEVKIVLPDTFLMRYKLKLGSDFKDITDKNLIIPITDNLLSVLSDLERKQSSSVVQKMYLESKVLEIVALQIENYRHAQPKNDKYNTQIKIKTLYELKQYLKDHLNENYSVLQLSRTLGLNEHLMKSEFKRVFECTINQYYTLEKMRRAKHLLQHTEHPIYQIAEEVGYKNATHFSAAFKRFFKETPKACRSKL